MKTLTVYLSNSYVPHKSFYLVFIILGDIEKKYHLGVSPLCDRQTESIANIQIGNYTYF